MQPADRDSALGHSWQWLFDLPHRLDVVAELIDDRQAPVFPVRSTPSAAAIRRMIDEREPQLLTAIADVQHATPTVRVVVGGFQVLCVRLTSIGVLVLAIDVHGAASDEGWRDLDLVASWMVNAIETTLTTLPNGFSVEPYRFASFERILTEAAARGSVRAVVGAFVEALGVWDRVRVDVYAGGAVDGFFRHVSPMGLPVSAVPAALDPGVVPRDHRMLRCSPEAIDRLGLDRESGDALLLRIATDEVSWLLLFTGTIDGPGQVRLALYADMLRESLTRVIAATIDRLVGAMTRDPLPPNEALSDAAQALLAQLTAAVAGEQSALVVSAATGRETLAVGSPDLLRAPIDRGRPDRLVVTSSEPRSVMTVAVDRPQPRFTAFERALVQAGVSALHPGVQAAIQGSGAGERRRQFRPVDSLFDQLAAETVGAGQPASVIIVSVDAAASSPGLLHAWLARIREQLRAGDFAGILSHTEIAVLLNDATAADAAVVAARLRPILHADTGAGPSASPVLRATTRSPESVFEGSLVSAARNGTASIH